MKYSTALVILSIVGLATCMPSPERRRQHRPHQGHGFNGGNQGFGGGPSFGGSGKIKLLVKFKNNFNNNNKQINKKLCRYHSCQCWCTII